MPSYSEDPTFHGIFEMCFPYCLEKVEEGKWVFLNRNYKPIGFNTKEYIEYEDYPVIMKIKGLGEATLKKLSYTTDFSPDKVYLYNDGCHPKSSSDFMQAYIKKLEILLKMK